MICPNCSHINPNDARFCQNCGKPLERACPNCSTLNGLEARFCKNCGTALVGEVGRNESQKTAPSSRQVAGPTGIRERRLVTILFTDVVGSTSLAEQMDPEEWAGIMDQAFKRMVAVIQRYEGKIARLMGDALLVFFGAPVAHEDDPLRAAAAALDLIQMVRGFADELRVQYGIDFAVRVGLNTGPVVVGDVGSSQVFEYTAMGDAVNLAARMQTAARPMSVFLSENTYRFLEQAYTCKDLGQIAVKGKAEPVHIYELVAPAEITGPRRPRRGGRSELVGRDEELFTLLELSQALTAGLGRAALISGEPGIGKSRLLAEWKERLQRGQEAGQYNLRWGEGRCLSYGRNLAYHLVIDLTKSLLDLPAEDDAATHLVTLQHTCQELFGASAAAEVFPYLAHLLGLPLEEAKAVKVRNLDPLAMREHYFESLRLLLSRLVERQPLILVLEDLHWVDPSSVDLLTQFLPLAVGAPVLFCLVTRPERGTPAWRLISETRQQTGMSLTEIHLKALSNASSDRLISNLLDSVPLPVQLQRLILEKAGGNPLFVEELVQMLLEREILVRDGRGWRMARSLENIDIPDSLQSLLLARIDQLPDEARRTLKVATVIGRQFPVRVLEEVRKSASLREQLAALEAVGLLSLAQTHPEIEYLFRHTLIQEAAYDSLLKSERSQLHLAVGGALEKLYPDRQEELALRLGEHFWQAGERIRAGAHFRRAAERAARTYANEEAIESYSRAAEGAADPISRAEILRARGLLYETQGKFEKAQGDQEAALELSRTGKDALGEWAALSNLGMLWAARDYRLTADYYQQALEIARAQGDGLLLARSLNNLGNYHINIEEPKASNRYHLEAIAIFAKADHIRGLAETVDFLAMANTLGSDALSGWLYCRQSIELNEELGNRHGLSSSLSLSALLSPNYQTDTLVLPRLTTGESIELGKRGYAVAAEIGWRAGEIFSLGSLVFCQTAAGNFHEALENGIRARSMAREIRHQQWEILACQGAGALHLEICDLEGARKLLEDGHTLAIRNNSGHWFHSLGGLLMSTLIQMGDLQSARSLDATLLEENAPVQTIGERLIWCARAELALAENRVPQALEIVSRLIQEAPNCGQGVMIRVWQIKGDALARFADTCADAEERERQMERAWAAYQEALEEAEALHYRSRQWKIRQDLARACSALGKKDEAKQAWSTAREEVLELSAAIPDEGLKAQYLSRALQGMPELP
ncbi:MAG TPA: adenylate/guanylate cyclase domain-containing protein [Anaerolineaceae bacterium]|nr:adenylate/guanylate cyclase domain-containing protein [Anaerolineaceae bacterium]